MGFSPWYQHGFLFTQGQRLWKPFFFFFFAQGYQIIRLFPLKVAIVLTVWIFTIGRGSFYLGSWMNSHVSLPFKSDNNPWSSSPKAPTPFLFSSLFGTTLLEWKVIGSRGYEILNHNKQTKEKELCQDEPKHLKGRTLLEQKFIDIIYICLWLKVFKFNSSRSSLPKCQKTLKWQNSLQPHQFTIIHYTHDGWLTRGGMKILIWT